MHENGTKLNLEKILDFSKPIIYLDIESSQRYFFNPKIIQIAAIKTFNHEIIDEINYWSKPNQKVEPRILKMVGKTQAFLDNKKSNSFVYSKMVDFIGETTQIVVFGDYDQVVLNFQAKKHSLDQITLIDIQKLFYSKVINSKKNQISLRLAAVSLGIEDLQKYVHDALLDARMLFLIVEATRTTDPNLLRRGFLFSMVTPRLKEFHANKDFNIRKVNFDVNNDFKLNYFTMTSLKKNIFDEDKTLLKRYTYKIDCEFYQFNQDPSKNVQIIDSHDFTEFSQDKIISKQQDFCLKIIDNHMRNSIFIYKDGFQYIYETFRQEYNALPAHYYIPYGHFELFIKDIQDVSSVKKLFKDPVKLSLMLQMIKTKILNI